jgi:hypothetical protein
MSKHQLSYAIQIEKRDILDIMTREIYEFMGRYNSRRAKEYLDSIVLPPSLFKLFEIAMATQQRIRSKEHVDGIRFMDVRVVCGALPFITFTYNDFHIAHMEAKRFTSIIGGVDA